MKMIGQVMRANRDCRRGVYDDAHWIQSSGRIIGALEDTGTRFHITGMENLGKWDGPVVIVGNHMSTLETFALPWVCRGKMPLTFVVKASLTRYPVFARVILNRDPIVVSRSDPRADLKTVLTEGVKRLEAGCSIILFPQKTRTIRFDPSGFNSIGVKLAVRVGVPVVPVAIKTEAWRSDGWPIKEFGKICPSDPVHMHFGEPMQITGKGRTEHEAIIRFIAENLKSWGCEVLPH